MSGESTATELDCLVIGGGINGTAICLDGAHKGLKTALIERHDLGSGTSSSSSQLIHGGLRYLENYEFKAVKKALLEREVLMSKAPFLIKPIQIQIPKTGFWQGLKLNIGLWLYDHLAKRKTIPRSGIMPLHEANTNLLSDEHQAAHYFYDCQTVDSRLVILNAKTARSHGAYIHSHASITKLVRDKKYWHATIQQRNQVTHYRARALVNATGPFIASFLDKHYIPHQLNITLNAGSHLIFKKAYEGEHGYLLPYNNRVIFITPYGNGQMMVGTTERKLDTPTFAPEVTEAEINYLLDATAQFLKVPLKREDILYSYAGIRVLNNQGDDNLTEASRDYDFDLPPFETQAPLLNVIGGKLTTHRVLAEDAIERLRPIFPNMAHLSTSTLELSGANYAETYTAKEYLDTVQNQNPWLPSSLLERWFETYGSDLALILQGSDCLESLGQHFGEDLFQAEVDYLLAHEWACSSEDILFRRTRLGIDCVGVDTTSLEDYIRTHLTS